MRLTGGTYRGRILEGPPQGSKFIRPTSDKVRQALFTRLESRGLVENAIVVDAFCGTGALGLEALSRGANCCTFIDKSPDSLGICRKNIAALDLQHKTFLILSDSATLKARQSKTEPATLVFLDPPYGLGLIEKAVASLQKDEWVAENAIFVCESEKNWEPTSLFPANLQLLNEKIYGDTRLCILTSPKNTDVEPW